MAVLFLLRREVWIRNLLKPRHFLLRYLYQAMEVRAWYLCVEGIALITASMVFRLEYEKVLTDKNARHRLSCKAIFQI